MVSFPTGFVRVVLLHFQGVGRDITGAIPSFLVPCTVVVLSFWLGPEDLMILEGCPDIAREVWVVVVYRVASFCGVCTIVMHELWAVCLWDWRRCCCWLLV